MADKPVIGFIGLGYMGHGMAKNILQNGYTLHVRGNRNRAPVDSLVGMGAKEAASAAAMAADCDIIHLCLSNSPQVEAVIRGPDGILAGGRQGLTVIDATTSDPTSTTALAAELAAKGITLVDAPLGRTPREAEAGTLDTMVGADVATFERIRPVIECWAGNINRTGEVGSAHKMKLVMNFISMGYAALYSEALVMAVKSGLTPQTVEKVIGGSRLANGFFDTFMKGAVGRDLEIHKFTVANAAKDLRYAASMAMAAGMANPLGAAFRNTFAQVEASGNAGDFVPMLADHVARWNGLDLAAAVEKGK
ncbi:MAG: NAD(P)-dependent oxidoreductase [Pseudooceanicola sp.]|nr:NAD(P)-dependent oxidoreductase [Pseudooceanicola sp.]